MKEDISLIIKGFFIGIAKVIPGVSGGLLAVSFGVYEDAIEAISCFFKDPKKHIYFLGKLGLGVLIAIILCSKLVLFCLNNYYIPTMFLFVGLIAGGIPSLFKKFEFKKQKNKIILLLIFFIFLMLSQFITLDKYIYSNTLWNHIIMFVIGYLDALTMVIPGISGTLVFMMLGVYEFVMNLFGNIYTMIFENPKIVILVGLGVVTGIYTISLLMNYLFHRHSDTSHAMITGFMISSLYVLLVKCFGQVNSFFSFFIGGLCFIIGFYFSQKIE